MIYVIGIAAWLLLGTIGCAMNNYSYGCIQKASGRYTTPPWWHQVLWTLFGLVTLWGAINGLSFVKGRGW